MRHTELIEYAVITLVVIFAVTFLVSYVFPVADLFKLINTTLETALVGAK